MYLQTNEQEHTHACTHNAHMHACAQTHENQSRYRHIVFCFSGRVEDEEPSVGMFRKIQALGDGWTRDTLVLSSSCGL